MQTSRLLACKQVEMRYTYSRENKKVYTYMK